MELIDEWRPDALLLDMLLAGETGVALLNELRSHDDLATLPVVVCSSVELDQGQLAPFGVRMVLDKSHATPAEIRAALRKVLA
jgi:CheY-like chemotaxis protein